MPKMKVKSGAKKRFRPKGSGYKFRSANRNHILTKKSVKRKRHLRGMSQVDDSNMKAVKRMLVDE